MLHRNARAFIYDIWYIKVMDHFRRNTIDIGFFLSQELLHLSSFYYVHFYLNVQPLNCLIMTKYDIDVWSICEYKFISTNYQIDLILYKKSSQVHMFCINI